MKSISVRHLTFSTKGGAGNVALSLHNGIGRPGVDSILSVLTSGDIKSVITTHPSVFISGLSDYYLVRTNLKQSLFSLYRNQTSSEYISDSHGTSEILHLHWTPGVIGSNVFSELPFRSRNIVWTLHDMFPFTGGCHHAMECEGYRSKCEGCPQVRPFFRKRVQDSLILKIDGIRSTRSLSVVTPSKWLCDKAQESEVFKNTTVSVIPNPVDTSIFRPTTFRKNIRSGKLVVGCNATNLLDPMKGILTLISVLERFHEHHPGIEVELVAIGGGELPRSKIKIRQSGFVSDPSKIVSFYQEMDVFVSMSLAEVFPLSIAEALSCGVPVICLNSGGMPEMIDHGVNGFVVDSPENLFHKLGYFSNLGEKIFDLGAKSRSQAVSLYSTNVVVNKYIDLYTQVLAK